MLTLNKYRNITKNVKKGVKSDNVDNDKPTCCYTQALVSKVIEHFARSDRPYIGKANIVI